jgi:hypothetical protein
VPIASLREPVESAGVLPGCGERSLSSLDGVLNGPGRRAVRGGEDRLARGPEPSQRAPLPEPMRTRQLARSGLTQMVRGNSQTPSRHPSPDPDSRDDLADSRCRKLSGEYSYRLIDPRQVLITPRDGSLAYQMLPSVPGGADGARVVLTSPRPAKGDSDDRSALQPVGAQRDLGADLRVPHTEDAHADPCALVDLTVEAAGAGCAR